MRVPALGQEWSPRGGCRRRPLFVLSAPLEFDISSIEKERRLSKHEQNPTNGRKGVPIAVTPYGHRDLSAMTVGTEEVVASPNKAIQGVTTQVHAGNDEREEVNQRKYCGWVNHPFRTP